jgi:isoquinoline 1-oxidoreductase subunit beta
MATALEQSRRRFLKAAAAVGGGLLLEFHLPFGEELGQAAEQKVPLFEPNAWVRIGADNQLRSCWPIPRWDRV